MKKILMSAAAVLICACLSQGSALSDAAAALSAGQSADFTEETTMGKATYSWQSDGVYDADHQLVHVMGKPANANQSWYHAVYNITADTWTPAANMGWDGPGHIYGNFAYDPATGDLFQSVGYTKRIKHYVQATGAWGELSLDYYDGSTCDPLNGVAWHPNLYGPGDGGLVISDCLRIMFWRKSTNTFENTSTGYINTFGQNAGDAIYFAAIDKVIIGRDNHARVSPNGGNKPLIDTAGPPPIQTGGLSTAYHLPFGVLTLHPGDSSKVLLLERVGSQRVWATTDGDNWTLESYTHPFDLESYVVVSISDQGVIWAIGNDGQNPYSKLWKPADTPVAVDATVLPDRPAAIVTAPNPFKSRVVISIGKEFQVASCKLSIFSMNGKRLETCNLKLQTSNTISWAASGLPSGLYLLKVSAGNRVFTKKLLLNK